MLPVSGTESDPAVPDTVPETEKMELPALLEGIWQGSDRYVFFVSPAAASSALIPPSDLVVILKTYYGWFYDRAAEPASYAADTRRFCCTATTKEAEHLTVTFEPLGITAEQRKNNEPGGDSGVWQICISYGNKHDTSYIPVAVIGNSLYLDFALLNSDGREDAADIGTGAETKLPDGGWTGYGTAEGLRICPVDSAENITVWYAAGSTVYKIRYWQVVAPYMDAAAEFDDGASRYEIPKHITAQGKLYTCTVGKSLTIRNVQKLKNPLNGYTLDRTGTICAFGKPYLTKVTGTGSEQQLMQIVAEANRRRKPDPPPLFPPDSINWHRDLIALLEKDNEQVQAVRRRQQEFAASHGSAGRDAAVQAASYSSYLKMTH
jgi:hypothetical protein